MARLRPTINTPKPDAGPVAPDLVPLSAVLDGSPFARGTWLDHAVRVVRREIEQRLMGGQFDMRAGLFLDGADRRRWAARRRAHVRELLANDSRVDLSR